MLTFAMLQAFTPYMGIGGGFVRSKRMIKNILDYNKIKKEFEVGSDGGVDVLSVRNAKGEEKFQILVPHEKHDNDSKLQRTVSQNGFLGKFFSGITHSTCSHIFMGLEVYGGYQKAENDYFKNGLFFGAQILAGLNMPYKIQGAIGIGLDILKQVSKAIDAKNERDGRYFNIQTMKVMSDENISYWSAAPCLHVMFSKDLTKDVMLRLEGQFVLPREIQTSEIQYKHAEDQTLHRFKINYGLSHQRCLLSLMIKF